MRGAFLEDLTWPEARARIAAGAVVVLHVGPRPRSTAPSAASDGLPGRHAGSDAAWLRRCRSSSRPSVSFGYYPAFVHYPGSQHLRAETFMAL